MKANFKQIFALCLVYFTLLQNSTAQYYQFGTGADGNLTVSTNTVHTPATTTVSAGAGTSLTVGSNTGFAIGDIALLMQMTGSTGKEGTWEVVKIAAKSGGTGITTDIALTKTYDFGTTSIQLIKITQYDNVTLTSGALTCPAWNGSTGGVLTFMVKTAFTITGGTLNVNRKGFQGTMGGAGGIGGTGGAGGIASTGGGGAVPTVGGTTGTVANSGIYGGADGGANGGAGTMGAIVSLPAVPGAGVPATNASNRSMKRYLMGAGGKGGNGGNAGKGGAGGGGGDERFAGGGGAINGDPGGNTGNGGNGGNGGTGGGIIIVFAKDIIMPTGVHFYAQGDDGTNATSGGAGGVGGAGGLGAGVDTTFNGGCGGGGNGGNGSNGGDGGNGGAGGFIFFVKGSASTSTPVIGNMLMTSSGGTGGAGGAGGIKGTQCLSPGVVVKPSGSGGSGGGGGGGAGGGCVSNIPAILTFMNDPATVVVTPGSGIYNNPSGESLTLSLLMSVLDCDGQTIDITTIRYNSLSGVVVDTLYSLRTPGVSLVDIYDSNAGTLGLSFNATQNIYADGGVGAISSFFPSKCFASYCMTRGFPSDGADGADGNNGVGGAGDFDSETLPDVLPVNLLTFTGKTQNYQSILDWATATELNNAYFEIERSSDGKTFETIGRVKGNGTSNAQHNYTFTDVKPLSTINYYRLRQINYDGASEYSNIISLRYKIENSSKAKIYPIPAQNELNIIFDTQNADETYTATISNNLGQILKTVVLSDMKTTISLANLPKGLYFCTITNSQERIVEYIVVPKVD